MNAPPPTAPAPSPAPQSWLRPADQLLMLLVAILAGCVAAFIARNSDAWLHLAAGRDLVNGLYTLGSDPYSFTHTSWINHSWLYDLGAYELFQLDGKGAFVVLAKAIALAFAFLLVMSIRPKSAPAWPVWIIAVIAAIAAAPTATLRPIMASALLTAIFLVILLQCRWAKGSWKYPLVLAGLTALWANLDAWFFLGPVMVALTLLSEWVQRKFSSEPDPDAPALKDLAKALGLCLMGTLLNPFHIGVWELPFEVSLSLPIAFEADAQIRLMRLSPLSSEYWRRSDLGSNANGYAFAALFVLGSGLLALGLSRVRLVYLAFWVLFGLLALLHIRMVLLFAIAAVPLIAAPLMVLATRFGEMPQTRVPSTLLRILGIPALLLLIACAWPGWLHPMPSDAAYASRVALGIEADEGLARAAKSLQEYRKTGQIPDTARGLPMTLEMANTLAWFAPGEKVPINGRMKHHMADFPAYLAARASLGEDAQTSLQKSLEDFQADFVILNSNGATNPVNILHVFRLADLDRFGLMHLDGRVSILSKPGSGIALRYDPVREAFSTRQSPLPEPVVSPPAPRNLSALDQAFLPPNPVPLATLDCVVNQAYANATWQTATQTHAYAGLALAGPVVFTSSKLTRFLPPVPDEVIACNLLAQRAARQAMAANPDHPLAYYVLGLCTEPREYTLPGFSRDEQETTQATAFRRFLSRMPPPAESGSNDWFNCFRAADTLANYYSRQQMADFAREARKLALEYRKRGVLFEEKNPDLLKKKLEELDKMIGSQDGEFAERFEGFQQLASAPAPQRLEAALRTQLIQEALKLIRTADLDKEFGADARAVELLGIQFRLRAGLIEEAIPAIVALQEKLKAPSSDPKAQSIDDQVRRQLAVVAADASRLAGDFTAYAQALDVMERQKPPFPAELEAIVRSALSSPDSYLLRISGTLDGALGGTMVMPMAQFVTDRSVAAWRSEAGVKIHRALVPLLNGQIAESKTRLEAARTFQGQPLPQYFGERAAIERYLNLMK